MRLFTLIDIFAGIGGLSLGFGHAGFECLAAVEYNSEHRKTLARIHPAANIDFHDITKVDGRRLLRLMGCGPKEIDVVVGGPPCQSFSMAGKRTGEGDERGRLIHHFVRFVEEVRPKAFVLENVVGLQSIHGGRLLREVLGNLHGLGYQLSPVGRLNAADYGVPQVRRRIFIVGLLGRHCQPFEFPRPTHRQNVGNRMCLAGRQVTRMKEHINVADAIADLPCNGKHLEHPDDPLVEDDVRCAYASLPATSYQRRMRGRKRLVTGNQTSVHSPNIVDAIRNLAQGEEEPRTRYRRLYADRPAFTLRAGSGSFTALRPIHPHRDRVITVREAARLQSFPDCVNFSPVKKWAYQGIGNSVPPIVAEAIAEQLIEFLW